MVPREGMLSSLMTFWLGSLGLLALAPLMIANHLSTAVTLVHGARVAQWNMIMFVSVAGFLVGGVTSWNVLQPYFEIRMLAVQMTSSEPLVGILLGVLTWSFVALIGATIVGVPIPTTLSIIPALLVGIRLGRVPVNLEPILSLVAAHGVVMVGSMGSSCLAYYFLNRIINDSDDPLDAMLMVLPFLFLFVIPIHLTLLIIYALTTFITGLSIIWVAAIAALIWIVIAIITWFWSRLFIVNRTKRIVFERHPQHVLHYMPSPGEERLAERGMVVGRQSPSPSADSGTSQTLNKARAEESFTLFLLTILAITSVSQGGLDLGTILGLHRVYSGLTGTTTSYWLIGILSMVLSIPIIALLTRRISRPLGDVAALGMLLTTAVELGCFLPCQIAIFQGWPISPLVAKLPSVLLIAWLGGRGVHEQTVWKLIVGVIVPPFIVIILAAATGYLLRA